MADLLGTLLKAPTAGDRVYYSIGNFTQRIDMVQAATLDTLANSRHAKIAEALFTKVRRIWKTRNYLIHSHYVHVVRYADGSETRLQGMGKTLGLHPDELGPVGQFVSTDSGERVEVEIPAVVGRGFAYEKHGKGGRPEHVFVNKGTFLSHADQVHKRSRQISVLTRAIKLKMTPTLEPKREPHATMTSHGKLPPRSRLSRS